MKLTDAAIRKAKPREKPYKLFDGAGLFLRVNPNGSRWWRFRYRQHGKEKLISLGTYPEVGLKEAREKCLAARKLHASGVDPGAHRKVQKATMLLNGSNTFEAIAREWYTKFAPKWADSHSSKLIRRLERDIFPWMGNVPIQDLTPPVVLAVLRRIESRGALETAHRAQQNCSQIFRYAVATGRTFSDPTASLRGALSPVAHKHFPTITEPKAIGGLLRAIDDYEGSHVVRCALRLAPLVFVRPGELRHAEWVEIDLEQTEWRIPAVKMKARVMHVVPLSEQAVAILHDLRPLTGNGRYLFPSLRGRDVPMSENTVNAALRRLGYSKGQMTGHGFRSMASTTLNEQGWHRDAIERQLAHCENDEVRAAYNYAQHLPERRRMMQEWANYLDALRRGSNVVPIRVAAIG